MRDKTNNLYFRPGPAQAGLYIDQLASLHSAPLRYLVPLSLDVEYNETPMGISRLGCTVTEDGKRALIGFAVTAKLIGAFVFAFLDCWFSHAAALI